MCVSRFRRVLAMGSLLIWALPPAAPEKVRYIQRKQFQLERSISDEAKACITCHKKENPGQFNDWAESAHAQPNVTCIDCHAAEEGDKDVSKDHLQYDPTAISAVVTPKDCSRCHPDEAKEYARSKHANTLEIIWQIDNWLKQGMNSKAERSTGCLHCHGTVLKVDRKGRLTSDTWPNVGVGRLNLDGSLGSCSICHTRHRFDVAEARKPEACSQCHLGPDHPQIEIYNESKHGAIYLSSGHEWRWNSAPGAWTAGVDYRAPTCASCHMSGATAGDKGTSVPTTHDVTERLSWEIQAPLTIRPSEFKPFPSKSHWSTEREKMKTVCQQCHSKLWANNHYKRLDEAVTEYNETYFKPSKKVLDDLKAKKLVSTDRFFDDPIEIEYYELWHHEGRRARMGVAMMAPDYAWWHGFYDLKKRFNHYHSMAHKLLQSGKPETVKNYPGATGDPTVPEEIKKRIEGRK